MGLDAETILIGMCIRDRLSFLGAKDFGILPEMFVSNKNRILWETIDSLDRESLPTDMVSMGCRLPDLAVYIAGLEIETPIAQNVIHYACEVSDLHWRIAAATLFASLGQRIAARQPFELVAPLKEAMRKDLDELFCDNATPHVVSLADALTGCMSEIDRRIVARQSGLMTGVSTGLKTLDKHTGGFQPKRLYVLAARTNIGKTTLALNFAHTALKQDKAVVFFTVEMPAAELAAKLLSKESLVSSANMQSGDLRPFGIENLHDGFTRLGAKRLSICDSFRRSFTRLKYLTQSLHRQGACDFLVVDYIQQLALPGQRFTSRHAELTEISSELKELAMELDIPILALAQLNREATKAGNEKASLAHIKDSGSIEQDADVVLVLKRNEEAFDENYEIEIAKNRCGERGSFKLSAILKLNTFSELAGL